MALDLPVWTVRPNWKGGILERLEWLTDVLGSEVGTEQRRALRLAPRRSYEMTVNPTAQERTYLDLLLHRLGSNKWLVPLWWDQGSLAKPAVVGAQALIFDNTFREHKDGGFALLFRSCFEYEVVEVQNSFDGSLLLAGDVKKPWPKGTKVYPLRKAYLDTNTSLKSVTTRVGASVLLFHVNEPDDVAPAFPADMPVYQGSPLLTIAPNRSIEITQDHVRLAEEIDNTTGLVERTDNVSRAWRVQSHNWQVVGREAQARFRAMLYALNGRQKMLWLPTFADDITVARPAAAGATRLDILNIGLGYVGAGSPIPGRARFLLGGEVLLHAGMGAAQGPNEERMVLGGPTTLKHAVGASGSFVEAARLNQDTVELTHHTDSDGVFECGASFRTFSNDRDGSGLGALPAIVGQKTLEPCGTPEDNPCDVTFPGWYWKVGLDWSASVRPASGAYPGFFNSRIRQDSPRFPFGGMVHANANINRVNLSGGEIDNMFIRDLPNGWDVLDGPNGGTMLDFRWTNVVDNAPGGYEWTFYFPIIKPGYLNWSHQFQFNHLPNGGGPAKAYLREWDGPGASVDTEVYRLFPADYGIGY